MYLVSMDYMSLFIEDLEIHGLHMNHFLKL